MNIKEEKEIAMILATLYAKWELISDYQERMKHDLIIHSIFQSLETDSLGIFKNQSDEYVAIKTPHGIWRFSITSEGDIIK